MIVAIIAIILAFGTLIAFLYGIDKAKDDTCQSIGYEKAVGGGGLGGGEEYCANPTGSQRVEFANCWAFYKCEVYKINRDDSLGGGLK